MSMLDLGALDRELRAMPREMMLDEYAVALHLHPGPHCPRRLQAVPRQHLVIPARGGTASAPAKTVRARPECDHAEEEPALVDVLFDEIHAEAGCLEDVLVMIHRALVCPGGALRSEGQKAGRGARGLPAARRMPAALTLLGAIRDEAPLYHPLWNTLLVHALLRELRPFGDGDTRTLLAFVSYELWRQRLYGPALLPCARVLEANGDELARRDRHVVRTRNDGRGRVLALARMLTFLLRVLIIAISHSAPRRASGLAPATRRRRDPGC